MVWRGSSNSSLNWIRLPTRCSCFADGGETVSRACTGEKDGFILLYKRLEQGAYQWPHSESEVKTLTPQQYRWLMEGLQIEQPKAHRPVTGLSAV